MISLKARKRCTSTSQSRRKKPFQVRDIGSPEAAPPAPLVTDRLLLAMAVLFIAKFIIVTFLIAAAICGVYQTITSALFFVILSCIVSICSVFLNRRLGNIVFNGCGGYTNSRQSLYWKHRFISTRGMDGIRCLPLEDVYVHCAECEGVGPVSIVYSGHYVECSCGNRVQVVSSPLQYLFFSIQKGPERILSGIRHIYQQSIKCARSLVNMLFMCLITPAHLLERLLLCIEVQPLRQYEWSGAVLHKYLELKRGQATLDELCKLFKRPTDEGTTLMLLAQDYLRTMHIASIFDGKRLVVDELELLNIHIDHLTNEGTGSYPSFQTG